MDELRYIDDSHYTTRLRQQSSLDNEGMLIRIEEGSQANRTQKIGSEGHRIVVRPASDASMTPNLPEEPSIRALPDRTVSFGTIAASALDELSLDQPSRALKRPAGSDIHASDRSTRPATPAKYTHKSTSNLRSSPEIYGKGPRANVLRKSYCALRQASSPHHVQRANLANQSTNPYESSSPADLASSTREASSPLQSRKPSDPDASRPKGAQKTTEDAIADWDRKRIAKNDDARLGSSPKSSEDPSNEDGQLLPNSGLLKQPESRPISEEQLAAEVKGIYSGLVIVETKCINVINTQNAATRDAEARKEGPAFSKHVEYFQGLIALHRTLLQEQHDFFLASQHPSATVGIRNLASKHSMPARMWKHGIHNFLELLRHHLPASLDYMLAFIYLAFQMMALLYETVPSFKETWIECLGDLARYRMAIEEEDLRDREIWTGVARRYYLKAVDKNADVGRLYHHLAILARSHPLQQVSLYCRSLTANQPFPSTRESIKTLLSPTLNRFKDNPSRVTSVDTLYVTIIAALYTKGVDSYLDELIRRYIDQLYGYIARIGPKWRDAGACIAIANVAATLRFGSPTSRLCKLLSQRRQPQRDNSKTSSMMEPTKDTAFPNPDELPDEAHDKARKSYEWRLLSETLKVALQRPTDINTLPHIHVMLVFFSRLASIPLGIPGVTSHLPLPQLVTFLNTLVSLIKPGDEILQDLFVTPKKPYCHPLPEDYAIRGQLWSNGYFPLDWFESASSDHDERYMEQDPKHVAHLRAQRILWLAVWTAVLRRTFDRHAVG